MSSDGGAEADAEAVLCTLALEIQRYLSPKGALGGVSSCSVSLRSSFLREAAWRRLCLGEFSAFLSTEPSVSPPSPTPPRSGDDHSPSSGGGDLAQGGSRSIDSRTPTWQSLYGRLRGLETVRWNREEGGAGTSPELRPDPCEYGVSDDGTVLIRSGGKYFFVVNLLPLNDFDIVCRGGGDDDGDEGQGETPAGKSDTTETASAEIAAQVLYAVVAAEGAPGSAVDGADGGDIKNSAVANAERAAEPNSSAPIGPDDVAVGSLAGAASSGRGGAIPAPSTPSAPRRRKYGVRAGRWSKVRTAAAGHPRDVPGPRTGHTLTPLPCGRRLVLFGGRRPEIRHGVESADDAVYVLTMDDSSGDDGGALSCDDLGSARSQTNATFPGRSSSWRGVWSRPRVAGTPPSPRLGHAALPFWKASMRAREKSPWNGAFASSDRVLIAMVGGTKGASSIADLEVHLLDLTDPDVALWSTVGTSTCPISGGYGLFAPLGRFGHEAFFAPTPRRDDADAEAAHDMMDEDRALSSGSIDIVVFGGRQYAVTLGYLDSWRGTLSLKEQRKGRSAGAPQCSEVETKDAWEITWRRQGGEGESSKRGPGPRRGHSAYALGRKLVVFGGAADGGGDRWGRGGGKLASNEVWVLDAGADAAVASSSSASPSRPPWYVPPTTATVCGKTVDDGPARAAAAPEESESEDTANTVPAENSSSGAITASKHDSPGEKTEPAAAPQAFSLVPAPRRGHSARVVSGRLVISGGYGADGEKLNNREGYELCFC